MHSVREELQLFVRRFGILNASCCEVCCGEEVSLAQSHILFEVRRLRQPSMQRVAEALGMDVTTFSRQSKMLESRGLITRTVSPEDRRVSLLDLTETGEQVLSKIDRYMIDRIERIFSFMTGFERDSVIRALGLLNEALIKADQPEKVVCCK